MEAGASHIRLLRCAQTPLPQKQLVKKSLTGGIGTHTTSSRKVSSVRCRSKEHHLHVLSPLPCPARHVPEQQMQLRRHLASCTTRCLAGRSGPGSLHTSVGSCTALAGQVSQIKRALHRLVPVAVPLLRLLLRRLGQELIVIVCVTREHLPAWSAVACVGGGGQHGVITGCTCSTLYCLCV